MPVPVPVPVPVPALALAQVLALVSLLSRILRMQPAQGSSLPP
jgi:hypothetical protein